MPWLPAAIHEAFLKSSTALAAKRRTGYFLELLAAPVVAYVFALKDTFLSAYIDPTEIIRNRSGHTDIRLKSKCCRLPSPFSSSIDHLNNPF